MASWPHDGALQAVNLARRAKVSAYVVAAVYSGLLFVFNVTVPSLVHRVGSALPLAVVVAFTLFDNWLWHVGPCPRLAKRPDLRGTWLGELNSYWRDERDELHSDSREVALVIREDYTTVSVTLLSPESKSLSSAAEIVELQPADFALMYQYQNTPALPYRRRSPIHSGGATVSFAGYRPGRLSGEYWTARDSRGVFTVELANREIAGTFDEAKAMRGN